MPKHVVSTTLFGETAAPTDLRVVDVKRAGETTIVTYEPAPQDARSEV